MTGLAVASLAAFFVALVTTGSTFAGVAVATRVLPPAGMVSFWPICRWPSERPFAAFRSFALTPVFLAIA